MSTEPFKQRSLREQLTRYWAILALASVGSAVVLGASTLAVDYQHRSNRVLDDLRAKAMSVSRRLSSELLLGKKGAVQAVIETLVREMEVAQIALLPEGVSCTRTPSTHLCRSYEKSSLWTEELIPYINGETRVILSQPKVVFAPSVSLPILLASSLPLVLLLGCGLFVQWRFLNRQILAPIGVLLETGGAIEEPASWPHELRSLSEKLRRLLDERDRAMKDNQIHRAKMALSDLSERILHDLKSPIGTLDLMLETDLKTAAPETKDTFRRVLGRIHGIINLNFNRYSPEDIITPRSSADVEVNPAPSCSLLGVAANIIEEESRKAKERGISIIADLPRSAVDAFVPVHFSELSRVLSNLINNAMDASELGEKRVYVALSVSDSAAELVIRDYGRGFDPETLMAIESGERRTTKATGSGLGLKTARAVVRQAHGKLTIQNASDGATVQISLPKIDPPEWFYDITRSSSQRIVALDDDTTISKKLDRVFPGRDLKFTQTESEFLRETALAPDALLLVDFDYGGDRNGIDLIVSAGLTRQAVIVSGRISFDSTVRAQAEKHGLRLFPKECLG